MSLSSVIVRQGAVSSETHMLFRPQTRTVTAVEEECVQVLASEPNDSSAARGHAQALEAKNLALHAEVAELRQALATLKQSVAQESNAREAALKRDLEAARIEGREAGRHEVEREFEALRTTVHDTLHKVVDAARSQLADTEPLVVEAVMAATARILAEAAPSGAAIVATVRNSLAELGGDLAITVRVAPRDQAVLEQFTDAHRLPIEVRADATITPGGCLVEFAQGAVDARVETVLERLYAALRMSGNEN